jgi:hypothetical protein
VQVVEILPSSEFLRQAQVVWIVEALLKLQFIGQVDWHGL